MSLRNLAHLIDSIDDFKIYGTVKAVKGLLVRATLSSTGISAGTPCWIHVRHSEPIMGEVIGFDEESVLLMPYHQHTQITPGARVDYGLNPMTILPDESWCGRVLNALGQPVDHKNLLLPGQNPIPIHGSPPSAHDRKKVGARIDVGIRSINTFLTTCRGQRLGIFAGSGVGKSMLLSMLARYTACDICVIGLIGERGREVREFIEDTLGPEGLAKSIIVVATSDESPLMRRRAAYMTMAIAEHFRNQGAHVLCLMDSVTRLAMAQREIGLSGGEPPTTKGYTPSVFTELAQIMERAGPGVDGGDITAFFTVLVDGDDFNEPIADAARGILDGHIVLDRVLAERAHFPAINISKSLSRTVPACHTLPEQKIIQKCRKIIATFTEMEDMIRLGAYREGTNHDIDYAMHYYPKVMAFLAQHHQDKTSLEHSFSQLRQILGDDQTEN